jgi:hypothetical protein
MAQSRLAAPGGARRDFATAIAPRTNVVAELETRLSAHTVLAVFGEASPALSTSEARQLFATHFKTPLSAVTATCHGPYEFLLFFTDPVKAKEAQTYSDKLVLGGTSFLLRPWSRLRKALTGSLPYKVRVCLERTTSSPLLLCSPGRPW